MTRPLDPAVVAHRVRDLPALPAVLREVLRLMRTEALHADELARQIEHDQALCSRTLRLANSPFYGLPGRVGTVHDALQLLGLRTVAGMMTAASLNAFSTLGRCPGFDFAAFWRHAMAVSLGARAIAQARGGDADQAAVSGLLHDVGQLALATYFPDELAAALDLGRSADLEPAEAERSLLGLDHADVGGMLVRHWGLPAGIVAAVEQHHRPPRTEALPAAALLIDAVHLADAVAHALNAGGRPDAAVPAVSLDSWNRLDAGRLDSDPLFAHVEQGVQALWRALDA